MKNVPCLSGRPADTGNVADVVTKVACLTAAFSPLRSVFGAVLLLAGVMALPLHAQEQTPAASTTVSSPPSTEQPAPEHTSPAPSRQPAVIGQRFDDWTLRCIQPETAPSATSIPACELAQSVQIEQDGKRIEILNLAVSRADDKAGKAKWALVVLTPLDVHLPSDLGLAAGAAKPVLTRYRNCNTMGCFALVPLDEPQLRRLEKATEGAVFFRLLNQRAVKVVFSLNGFAKAFTALETGKIPVATVIPQPESDNKGSSE